ncbi:MAG: HD family hydrolase [Hyphomicrobiales bacterium]|nr:HD family hydrolase [Hyphomicrobiales bacterium]
MLSGRRLNLLDPSPIDIEIEDIAHGLARVARWNGQTTGRHSFSVAQHCILVADLCRKRKPGWPAKWELAALLHDAPEYVIGDMISPFKAAIGLDYKNFERNLRQAIHIRFGLPPQLPDSIEAEIYRADRSSAFFEAVEIAGFSRHEATRTFSKPRALKHIELVAESPRQAQEDFLNRFKTLRKKIQVKNSP